MRFVFEYNLVEKSIFCFNMFFMETTEITNCINTLIATLKSLEGHIDSLETENALLRSENESLNAELAQLKTDKE